MERVRVTIDDWRIFQARNVQTGEILEGQLADVLRTVAKYMLMDAENKEYTSWIIEHKV